MASPFDLTGRSALVTGANTGIGQGIALALAEAGATVVAAGRSDMSETLALIADARGASLALKVDLQQQGIAPQVIAQAQGLAGPLDILVNNAGIIRRADALDFSESDWDEVMNVNLKATFFLAQAFAKSAVEAGRGARIVNIASLLSFQGGIRVASYTASKSGLAGLTKLLACEWAGKGINVNAIAPGYIESNNTEALRADPDRNGAILARIPAARWGKPSDIGGAAVFLASDAAAYMHGAIIPVDGGWLAR
ncbi:2-dehydro-3-deoxy-D-gluconate 5-dehydrogenase KduD [Bosea sp. PAMC 26642]|uniref:2-dehydro-3-deoxy-D-gluconate 5-dehydrogenase KduD n=1 Tax=Bosea sp. (strain PAMC 26642) TaxID=1792307 RepID=UPI000770130F|nr:2-dehydro-3-deoxy-D-gluconate 5-dehydrogenase KduD [Bosea sp. PAMC 26642]AMJ63697.1 2-deoxy-D-gluconate 3-dehydrogenase [Bosea sp. PAMC 26642]